MTPRAGLAVMLVVGCAAPQVRPMPAWRPVRVLDLLIFDAPPQLELSRDPRSDDEVTFADWILGDGRLEVAYGEQARDPALANIPDAQDYRQRLRPIAGRAARWATFRVPARDEDPELYVATFHVPHARGAAGVTLSYEAHTPGGQALGLRILETARLLDPPPAGAAPQATPWRSLEHRPPRCVYRLWDPSSRAQALRFVVHDRVSGAPAATALVVEAYRARSDASGAAVIEKLPPGLWTVEVASHVGLESCGLFPIGPGTTTLDITVDRLDVDEKLR